MKLRRKKPLNWMFFYNQANNELENLWLKSHYACSSELSKKGVTDVA